MKSSPAKLIISGEHSVLYGAPAIAVALDKFANAELSKSPDGKWHFDLQSFNQIISLTTDEFLDLGVKIDRRFENYLKNRLKIKFVINHPVELPIYIAYRSIKDLGLEFSIPLSLRLSSDIKVAAGMGSSAAIILCILQAIMEFNNIKLQDQELLLLAKNIEHVQHGCSSGLDLATSYYQSAVLYHNNEIKKFDCPEFKFLGVYSGDPNNITGECVAHAKKFMTNKLVAEFAETSFGLKSAFEKNDLEMAKDLIKQNHRLLVKIGVVPSKVSEFIDIVEAQGGAAKICGAGAISGSKAGTIMIVGIDSVADSIIKRFGYELLELKVAIQS